MVDYLWNDSDGYCEQELQFNKYEDGRDDIISGLKRKSLSRIEKYCRSLIAKVSK